MPTRRRSRQQAVHVLVPGASTFDDDNVEVRVTAAVAYSPDRVAADPQLSNIIANMPNWRRRTAVLVARDLRTPADWSIVPGIAAVPATDGTATFQLRAHSERGLPTSIRNALADSERIVVVTNGEPHPNRPAWQTIVLVANSQQCVGG